MNIHVSPFSELNLNRVYLASLRPRLWMWLTTQKSTRMSFIFNRLVCFKEDDAGYRCTGRLVHEQILQEGHLTYTQRKTMYVWRSYYTEEELRMVSQDFPCAWIHRY